MTTEATHDRWTLTFTVPAGDDAKARRAILWILKRALRNYGYQCVGVEVAKESEQACNPA